MNEPIKILIIDDHPAYLQGVTSLLQPIIPSAIITTALNGADTLKLLKQHPDTDWVFLDITLPDCSGLELLEQFKANKLLANIVVISADNDPNIIDQAFKLHVNGFLTKDFDSKVLLDCIRTIEDDRIYLIPEHAYQLKSYRNSVLQEKKLIEKNITERLTHTLVLIAKGYSNREIANSMGISESTVKKHTSSLIALFEADNRTHCVGEARRLNFID